jgi:hypothetical protein
VNLTEPVFVRVGSTSIDGAFVLAFGANYATSVLWLQVKSVLESGTSIIAFSIVLYLLAILLADTRIYTMRHRRSLTETIKLLLWIALLTISDVAAPTLILGNPSYKMHLVGIALLEALLMILSLFT